MFRWVLAAAAVIPAALACAASPTVPGVVLQPPAVYSFTIGEAKVTALSDGTMPMDLHRMLQGITSADIDGLLGEAFLVNPVQPPINCYVVQAAGRTVLIDAGMGDLFGPGNGGRLAEALRIAGIRSDQVDDILLTHIHPDHVGLLAVGGRMTFPKALVHAGKADLDLYLDPAPSTDPFAPKVAAALKPYRDAGRLRPFERDGEIVPGITAELRPGHSPGSAIFRLASKGRELVVIGDIVHVAQIQLPRPEVTFRLDHNPAMARADREDALRRFAAEKTLIASPHINFPGVGRVVTAERGYRWVPIEYANRDPDLPAPKF